MRTTSWPDSRDGRTRNGFSETWGNGAPSSGWNCTRKRRDWWSSDDLRQRIGDDAGSGNRRRSTFWGSRTTVRRPGRDASGWGGKPSAKRMNRTLQRVGERLWRQRHADHWEVGKWLSRVLNGWLNYFAVPGSTRWLRGFCYLLQRRWLRALRRRSQRDRFSWGRLRRMTELLWPSVKIRHPWPGQRFRWPSTPKVGAGCLNGHVRICAGGGRKLPFLP